MKKTLKYVLFGLIVAGFCTGMIFLVRSTRAGRASLVCKDIEVHLPDSLGFVSENDVKDYLRNEYGAFLGQAIDSVGLGKIEDIIESKSAVSVCEAWVTDDGLLHVSIRERKPAVLFQNGEQDFYVDDRGYIFPRHPGFTADVPKVGGALPFIIGEGYRGEAPSEESREWIGKVIRLTVYMEETGEWENGITTISASADGELTLRALPSKGDESILFGQPDMIEDKFSRIHKYYSHIKASKGDIYGTVNVKYKRQIICRTKDMSRPSTSEQGK